MALKDRIIHSPSGELLVNYYHEIEGKVLPKLLNDGYAVQKYCKKFFDKQVDLENPVLFYEKLNWYKLNGKIPLMEVCANKYTMRDYVREKGYGECLNDLLDVYSSVGDIDIVSLPDRFVLKASHGTHMQIIVKDKSKIDWKHSKRLMRSWLRQDIYWRGREWVYKEMPRHIIAEKYIEDESGELRDYKIFCFNGAPRFIQHDIGRFTKHIRNYYYTDWKMMDMTDYVGNDPSLNIPAPKSLQKMLEIAKDLSQPFQFVRIDFYEVGGQPYVGEMTFFHEGGSINLIPEKWNRIVGDYWELVE